MGLFRSDVSLEDDCNHPSNFTRLPVRISAPQLLCRNLWAPELGVEFWYSTLGSIPSTCVILLHPFSHRFLFLWTDTNKKTNNCTTIYLRSQYTLFVTTFHIFFIPSILHCCSELPSSIATKLQIRSDRTVRFLDFQQTDFNIPTGVGTSTSCFCLNYHNFLLPVLPQVIGSNNVSSFLFFHLTPTVLLSFNKWLTSCSWISTIRMMLTPALVASARTTTTFSTYVSFLSISKALQTTKSHCYWLFLQFGANLQNTNRQLPRNSVKRQKRRAGIYLPSACSQIKWSLKWRHAYIFFNMPNPRWILFWIVAHELFDRASILFKTTNLKESPTQECAPLLQLLFSQGLIPRNMRHILLLFGVFHLGRQFED